MATFKDAVLQLQDQPSTSDPVFTYEQLMERLNQPKPMRKPCRDTEDVFDFVNVNINTIICVVEDMKTALEPYGIMNEFLVKDALDIIYECVQIQENNEETSDDENENENDDDLLDVV
jgi:hypothetical protein